MTPASVLAPERGAASGRAAPRPLREAALVAGACCAFVALASWQASRIAYPYFDDVTYLELGITVRDMGGPLGLLRALLEGRFLEANRHPLYLALLSFLARPAPAFHREAQALAIGCGVVALLACWVQARRHLGAAAAVIAVWLLAIGRTFLEGASHGWCEPLLVACWAPAVGAALDGADPSSPRARGAWLRFGVWSGLAFLTKGTGIFLPVAFALALLARERLRVVRDRRAWAAAAAFLLVAAPLLVRNVRAFGSPLHNDNGGMLWRDRMPDFAETFAPQAALLPGSFLEYARHVTPGALAWRLVAGLGETIFILLESVAPAGGSPGSPVHVAALAAALVATVVALRRLLRAPRGLARDFLLAQVAWTAAILFVFSTTSANARHFLPLAATVLVPAFAAAVADDAARAGAPLRSRWLRGTAVAAAAAVLAAVAFPLPAVTWAPGMREVRDWLVTHVRPGETYAVDARSHLQPSWLLPRARQVIVSASWQERPVDEALLVAHLRRLGVRYVVLDASSTAHLARRGDPAGRRYLFYDRLPLLPDGSLPSTGFPAGFAPAYVDAAGPGRWMVLEARWSDAAAPSDRP